MGPVSGVRVLEVGGIGPVPFCGMMLSDLGAEVIRIERLTADGAGPEVSNGILERNRKRIAVDLKSPGGVDLILRLVEKSDVLIEGFRPGVMERLGLGPDTCLARNGRLIFGRMTGWGQSGPLSRTAGHDLNYISSVGVVNAIGAADRRPSPPLNLVGDYGGGGLMLAMGVCAALFERSTSGRGQVIDAAMCDGVALLMNTVYELMQRGQWSHEREANLMDGGAHFYGAYETSDGKFMTVAAAEPQFYRALLIELGLQDDQELVAEQMNKDKWPLFRERFAAVFKKKSREEWSARLLEKDVCCTPVLNFHEALRFPHNREREVFVRVGEFDQAAPAPRFSRTKSSMPVPGSEIGAMTDEILAFAGLSAAEAGAAKSDGIVL